MQNRHQKIRFLTVGGLNTLIDFGILFILKSIGLPVITANIFSTTAAFCFSFAANKKYTFKTADTNIKREFTLFIIVTLFGLWVLQTLVIKLVSILLNHYGLSDTLILLIAKVIATGVTLVWNYIMYSRFVFTATKGR